MLESARTWDADVRIHACDSWDGGSLDWDRLVIQCFLFIITSHRLIMVALMLPMSQVFAPWVDTCLPHVSMVVGSCKLSLFDSVCYATTGQGGADQLGFCQWWCWSVRTGICSRHCSTTGCALVGWLVNYPPVERQ
jgi:hypothetical protein